MESSSFSISPPNKSFNKDIIATPIPPSRQIHAKRYRSLPLKEPPLSTSSTTSISTSVPISSPLIRPKPTILQKYTFTSLPPELRNSIYTLCFPPGYITTIGLPSSFAPYFSKPGTSRRSINLLFMCKQICIEARRVLYANTVFFLMNSNYKVKRFLTETSMDALRCIKVVEVVHGEWWPLVLEDEGKRKRRLGKEGRGFLGWRPEVEDLLSCSGEGGGYESVVKMIGERLSGLEVLSLNLHILDVDAYNTDDNFLNWPEISHHAILTATQDRTYPHFKVWGKPLADLAHRIIADEMSFSPTSETAVESADIDGVVKSLKPQRNIFLNLKTLGAVLIPMFRGRGKNATAQPLWVQVYPDHDIEYLGHTLLVPGELTETAMEGLSWIAMIGRDAEVW